MEATRQKKANFQGFSGFLQLVARLRSKEGGCPWDLAQTHQTLAPYVLEEAYEVVEAIERGEPNRLQEELGDLLLQVVLHAQLASEAGQFSIQEIIQGIITKMIYRHPHVFDGGSASSAEGVLHRWETLKREEKQGESGKSGTPLIDTLRSVSNALPALYRAEQVQKKAARFGFDWKVVSGAWEKVKEEVAEIEALGMTATANTLTLNQKKLDEELGDLLFSVVNVTRKLGADAETLLRASTHKFLERFAQVEQEAARTHQNLEEMEPDVLDQLWNRIKQKEQV